MYQNNFIVFLEEKTPECNGTYVLVLYYIFVTTTINHFYHFHFFLNKITEKIYTEKKRREKRMKVVVRHFLALVCLILNKKSLFQSIIAL